MAATNIDERAPPTSERWIPLLDHEGADLDLKAKRLGFIGRSEGGSTEEFGFDRLVPGTGSHPVQPAIDGLADLGPDDGCMCCTRAGRVRP